MLFAIGAKILGAFGLGPDLAKRFAWAPLVAIAALLIFAAVKIVGSWQDKTIETAREAGATGAVLAGQKTTLEQVKDANDAEQDLRAGGERSATRHADCLRDNRKPETCERFRPLDRQPVLD